MHEYLSPEEKSRLIAFNQDEGTKNAVKKVLLYSIYQAETLKKGEPAGLDKNWVYGVDQDGQATDEEVGKKVRIKIAALAFIESAFEEVGNYRAEVTPSEEPNPAL